MIKIPIEELRFIISDFVEYFNGFDRIDDYLRKVNKKRLLILVLILYFL